MLAEVVALIATGRNAPMQTLAKPEETRKELLAKSVKGRRIIVFDNIPESGLYGDVLPSFITSRYVAGRVLGSTEDVEVEVTSQIILTGNHVEMEDDFVRRMLVVFLNAGVDDPKERSGFRHPNLITWIKANRPKIIWACLTLIQNYIAKTPDWSAPKENGVFPSFASFEEYARVMDGVLKCAGIDGFLENRKQFKEAKEQGSQDATDAVQAIFDKVHTPGYDGKFPTLTDAFWKGEEPYSLATSDLTPVIYEDGLCKFAVIEKSDRKRSDGSIKSLLSRRLGRLAGKRYKVQRTLPEKDETTRQFKTRSVFVSFGMEEDSTTNKKAWLLRFIADADGSGDSGK
ncbi:MAG: hypothetical protein QM744_02830 [Mesorhizobium sp.]